MSGSDDDTGDMTTQRTVAAVRAQVMGGRGAGASSAEIARFTHERPTLGALPAPLERELVHLSTERIRAADGALDAPTRQHQIDRVREVWDFTGAGSVEAALTGSASVPEPARARRSRSTVGGGVVAGIAITLLIRRVFSGRHREHTRQ